MRTTVSISDHLLQEAKLLAARTQRSVDDVLEDALRVLFARRDERSTMAVALPIYGGSGVLPGVDLEDRTSLAALIDENLGPPR